jgi:hypothetical protein
MARRKNIVPKTQREVDKLDDAAKVPVNTLFQGETFRRLFKYKRDKGLLFEQEVVRLAVANFLEQSGY